MKISRRLLVLALVFALLLTGLPTPVHAGTDPAAEAASPPAGAQAASLSAGGWVAFTLHYPGDYAKLGLLLDYSPSDDPNDVGLANGNQVTMAVYSPAQPPPNGKPTGWAGGNGGQKRFQLEASVAGSYVVIVNNWDSQGRRIDITLKAVVGDVEGDLTTAANGPALVFLSTSETTVEPRQPRQPDVTAPAKRVGIQAGHWLTAQLPAELAGLRKSTGTSGGGVPEWQLNLDVAKRVKALLEAKGVAVDVLPSTIPVGYQADAFVALHADGDLSGRLSGFKLAHGRWSGNTAADKSLLNALTVEYQAATGLPTDWPHVSRNMTGYYAFNNQRYKHAVGAGTPAVILEMGFMTNSSNLRFMLSKTDAVAQGIAQGILRYLGLP
ncbi:MAG: N-acetylmuramoyl-L-alanine amidase family protein [Chloroflexota bacterium]